jgi:hypothetical protein
VTAGTGTRRGRADEGTVGLPAWPSEFRLIDAPEVLADGLASLA